MRWPLVVDVPVLFSDKFLQSKEFDLIVPQIQFIFRVWDIRVVEQRRVHTVRIVHKTGDSPGAVLGRMSTCPLVCKRQVLGVQTVQKTLEVPQLQFIDEGSCRWNLLLQVSSIFQCEV